MRAALRKVLVPGALLVALATPGCGGGSRAANGTEDGGILGQYPPTPFASATSTSGRLHVEARTAPFQPPRSGNNSVLVSISDAGTRAPVDGSRIAVGFPYETSMSMVAPVEPSVAPKGHGLYLLTSVDFSMEGSWVIPLTVEAGDGGTDTIALAMSVTR